MSLELKKEFLMQRSSHEVVIIDKIYFLKQSGINLFLIKNIFNNNKPEASLLFR